MPLSCSWLPTHTQNAALICAAQCAVPQDLADSKRINTNVQSVPNTATPLRRRRHLVDIGAMQVLPDSGGHQGNLHSSRTAVSSVVLSMLRTPCTCMLA